jgi:hypothetical protein
VESTPANIEPSNGTAINPEDLQMISTSFRLTASLLVGAALSFGVLAAQAAKGGHDAAPAPSSSTNTKVKPALETCVTGQHCTGMPQKKCTTEYVAVCPRHHSECQTVQKTVCS